MFFTSVLHLTVYTKNTRYVFYQLKSEYFLGWRAGCYSGTEENEKVSKTLMEMWAFVEQDIEKHAVSLLR